VFKYNTFYFIDCATFDVFCSIIDSRYVSFAHTPSESTIPCSFPYSTSKATIPCSLSNSTSKSTVPCSFPNSSDKPAIPSSLSYSACKSTVPGALTNATSKSTIPCSFSYTIIWLGIIIDSSYTIYIDFTFICQTYNFLTAPSSISHLRLQ
jgi:hypothetical protein